MVASTPDHQQPSYVSASAVHPAPAAPRLEDEKLQEDPAAVQSAQQGAVDHSHSHHPRAVHRQQQQQQQQMGENGGEASIPEPAPEALALGYAPVSGKPTPPPKKPSPGKVEGRCKWFDLTKGWGFIVRPDGLLPNEDIFVHSSCVTTRPGYRGLADNEAVEFIISKEANGRLRAVQVTALGGGPALGQSPHPQYDESRPRVCLPHTNLELPKGRIRGTVRSFNAGKGFGFILSPGIQDDIFVHQSDLIMAAGHYRSLAVGENVEFTLQISDSGKKAVKVTGPGGTYCVGVPRPPDQRHHAHHAHPQYHHAAAYHAYHPHHQAAYIHHSMASPSAPISPRPPYSPHHNHTPNVHHQNHYFSFAEQPQAAAVAAAAAPANPEPQVYAPPYYRPQSPNHPHPAAAQHWVQQPYYQAKH